MNASYLLGLLSRCGAGDQDCTQQGLMMHLLSDDGSEWMEKFFFIQDIFVALSS